jgi:hypothetical protein
VKHAVRAAAQFTVASTAVMSLAASSTRAPLPTGGSTLWLCASGTSVVFVKLGDETVVATGSDFAILPNSCAALVIAWPQQLAKPTTPSHLAAGDCSIARR